MVSPSSLSGAMAAPDLTLPASHARGGHPATDAAGGYAVPGGGRPSQPTGRAWWSRLQFAVAAVLILGLFATILAPMDDGQVGQFGGVGNDSTPTSPPVGNVPSIGYPGAFTGGGWLIDLPMSQKGHTISLNRVTLTSGATLPLPPDSIYLVSSVTGLFTVERVNGSSPLQIDRPSSIDIDTGGGAVIADRGGDVSVSVLTIAAEGTLPLASADGVTAYPLISYPTGEYRFETQINVVFGSGPAGAGPEPVPPSGVADLPQNLSSSGTTMLLYAEQGSIEIDSPDTLIEDINLDSEYQEFVGDLTIQSGETAVVRNPSLASIQRANPDEGAVYTAVFLAPPALDRTPGRTYSNTHTGSIGGPFSVATDGRDYQVVLDRLTLAPGAILSLPPGIDRGVQWTGGGDMVMNVSGGTQSPLTLPNPTVTGSFGDAGFSLVQTGDTPVTLTLLSVLPSGASDETVPAGQEGVATERLTTYTASNPSNATELQVLFSATSAEAFPVEIDYGLGLNTGRSISDSYALIRAEAGSIVLDRPASRIVDGRETIELANGEPLSVGETVRVNDLLGATISGPSDGSPAGYTVVIVSPITNPIGTSTDVAPPAALTGLTPSSVDVSAELAAGQPVDIAVVRHTLGPDGELTVFPDGGVPTNRGVMTFPITVITYVASGDGTATAMGQPAAELASRSSDVAMHSAEIGSSLTIRAGGEGLTIFQLTVGSSRPGLDSAGEVESVELGQYQVSSPLAGTIDPLSTVGVRVRVMLRATVGSGEGASQILGGDGAVTLLTPLAGDARIVPGVGVIRLAGTADSARAGTLVTMPETVTTGSSVIAEPGGQFRVAPSGGNLSYLWAEVEIIADETTSATPMATPTPGTPAAATACDIAPRTVEELLALYDQGVANPVDPLTVGYRDDAGTGAPADPETVAGVTGTLTRLVACQDANDPLRRYALYSDAGLRVVLPLTYETRDDVTALPDRPAAQNSSGTVSELSVSDVKLFADGRAGARVVLGTEFAYVTLSLGPDGSWLIDLWDDRDEPGV